MSSTNQRMYLYCEDTSLVKLLDTLPKNLVLCNQHVLIDGKNVKKVKINNNELSWTCQISGGNFEHESVCFDLPHLLQGYRCILVTLNKDEPEYKDNSNILQFYLITTPTKQRQSAFNAERYSTVL